MALLLLALTACGRGEGEAGPGLGAELDGRTFLSTSVTEYGKTRQLVPGTRISLRFHQGRLNADAGCNQLSGGYRVDSATLVVNEIAMTEMACVPPERMDQDTWLVRVLTGRPTIAVDGDTLVLAGGAVEIRMLDRVTVDPDRSLAGPRWVIESIITGDAMASVPQPAGAQLTFAADGRVSGNTGCNEFHGTYQASAGMITFSQVGMTKKACQGAASALELAVTKLFAGGPVAVRIEADQMTVTYSDGSGGLQLRAQLPAGSSG